MVEVYYPNAVFLLIPLLEALTAYWRAWHRPDRDWAAVRRLLPVHVLYCLTVLFAFLPTLITRQIIYGSAFEFGYGEEWFWTSPALKEVLFSANHGLLSWTPILIPAMLGLFLFRKADRQFGGYLLVAVLGFYYLIASYENWTGLSSYGNRFFVSLTPVFVLGLAASLAAFARLFASARQAVATAGLALSVFVLWNVGLIFQWGTHMIPVRGPIAWREMAYNQVTVVPDRMFRAAGSYLVARRAIMHEIEQKDLKQLLSQKSKAGE